MRELENTVERSVALETGRNISLGVLPANISGHRVIERAAPASKDGMIAIPEEGVDFEQHLGEAKRRYLLAALERAGGVQRRAAELLKISYDSFRHYTKKYKIQ